jgi:hypothetical protein
LSIKNTIPDNFNPLQSNHGATFFVKKLPMVNFFCQKYSLPGLSIQEVAFPNPFVKIPLSGDHIDYDELRVSFLVDEDLKNYLEVHMWLRRLGFPKEWEEYRVLDAIPIWTGEGKTSDAVLTILDAKKLANVRFAFHDAFPISLSDIMFDTTASDTEYAFAIATFAYVSWNPERIQAV